MKTTIFIGSILLIFVVVPIFCVGWFFYGDTIEEYFNRIPFDSAKWKNEEFVGGQKPIRIRMVDDLLKRHKLVGISKAEIEHLLGVPSKIGYSGENQYLYWLGPERGFISIDSEWLVIHFEDNRVIGAWVRSD